MRTRKTLVILISGKAGSGKTTVADILTHKLTSSFNVSTFRYGFADPLKYIAKAYIGWDGNKDEKGRKLLQEQGRIGREYDENIWVKHFINQLDRQAGIMPYDVAVIHDWRFPNELAYLQQNPLLNTITIRVFGRGGLDGDTAQDVSENSLPEAIGEWLTSEYNKEPYNLGYDYTLDNSDSTEILEHKLDIILAEIEKQYIVK